jgi:hypothetical protein
MSPLLVSRASSHNSNDDIMKLETLNLLSKKSVNHLLPTSTRVLVHVDPEKSVPVELLISLTANSAIILCFASQPI